MFKKKSKTSIFFDYIGGKFDFPKRLPIPQIGSGILMDGKVGKVRDVRYDIAGNDIVITIFCSRWNENS